MLNDKYKVRESDREYKDQWCAVAETVACGMRHSQSADNCDMEHEERKHSRIYTVLTGQTIHA